MKRSTKSLLPKGIFDREALNKDARKVKPRLSLLTNFGDFRRLKDTLFRLPLLGILFLIPLGLYPNLPQTPVTQPTLVSAQEQKGEILSNQLSKPINLPHPGYLTTRYSRWHPGVDIAAGLGMPIRPITEGVVEEVLFGFLGYGNHLILSHVDGFKSLYAHMGRVFVKKGQNVTHSTILGEVGMTGFTSGPHTHLEVFRDGVTIDPLTILPQLSEYPKESLGKPSGGAYLRTDLHKSLKPDF